ncbi:hypothetical protein D3C86_1632110 [compost metagenome]
MSHDGEVRPPAGAFQKGRCGTLAPSAANGEVWQAEAFCLLAMKVSEAGIPQARRSFQHKRSDFGMGRLARDRHGAGVAMELICTSPTVFRTLEVGQYIGIAPALQA